MSKPPTDEMPEMLFHFSRGRLRLDWTLPADRAEAIVRLLRDDAKARYDAKVRATPDEIDDALQTD